MTGPRTVAAALLALGRPTGSAKAVAAMGQARPTVRPGPRGLAGDTVYRV